jgi:hypothetical protein
LLVVVVSNVVRADVGLRRPPRVFDVSLNKEIRF